MTTTYETLTKVAASIVVMNFVMEIVLERQEARKRRIECDAVKAEYQATVNAESCSVFHKIEMDESQPEWKRTYDQTVAENNRKTTFCDNPNYLCATHSI